MSWSNSLVKLRSLAVSSLVLGFAAASGTGCFIIHEEGDHHHGNVVDPGPDDTTTPAPEITEVRIDSDQTLNAEPGEGVGIFVEYRSGGGWHVWTTCDTFTSKAVCSYKLFASFENPDDLKAYMTDELEGQDEAVDLGDGEIQLIADTDSDTDGMYIEANAGSAMTLEVYLDGAPTPELVYWVGDGIVHPGAPNNPIAFLPSGP